MTKSNLSELFAEDPEIERKALWNLRAWTKQRVKELWVKLEDVQSENIAKPQRTMSEYTKPSLTGVELSIIKLIVAANNFEIKPNII